MHSTIWTIGHSTRSLEDFVAMLHAFDIGALADIRSFPGSRRYPHFNKEHLEVSMPENGIAYFHFRELGGRRKVQPGSANTGWRSEAFQGYADYMKTEAFREGIKGLERVAAAQRMAYMCSEAVWWQCHRSLVSDYLKISGWTVMHIMAMGKAEEHPYTRPARIVDGKLSYRKDPDEGPGGSGAQIELF